MSELPGKPLDPNVAANWLAGGVSTAADMRARLPKLRELVDGQRDRVTAARAAAAERRREADEADDVQQAEEALLTAGEAALRTAEAREAAQAQSERQTRENAEAAERAAEKERQREIEDGLIRLGKSA